MDTPDTLLICTAPFIFIRISCWSQPGLPGAQAHSQHGGRPLGSPGAGRLVRGHRGSARGWGGDECARPQTDQQRGSAAPSRSVPCFGARFTHGCLSLWPKLLGGWQMERLEGGSVFGPAVGIAGCFLQPRGGTLSLGTKVVPWACTGWQGTSQQYSKKTNWKQTVWLKTLSRCMKVLVSCKQMYSETVLRVTKSNTQNTQKKAKLIFSLAPPYLLLRRGINGYWKIWQKCWNHLTNNCCFLTDSADCPDFVFSGGLLTHRVAGQSKSKISFLLI